MDDCLYYDVPSTKREKGNMLAPKSHLNVLVVCYRKKCGPLRIFMEPTGLSPKQATSQTALGSPSLATRSGRRTQDAPAREHPTQLGTEDAPFSQGRFLVRSLEVNVSGVLKMTFEGFVP